MIYRERIRFWKKSAVEVLTVVAQSSKSPELLNKLAEYCDELLSMVLHTSGAYDLLERPDNVHSKADKKMSDEELLALLDKKLENG
jgi:hypothetical protein